MKDKALVVVHYKKLGHVILYSLTCQQRITLGSLIVHLQELHGYNASEDSYAVLDPNLDIVNEEISCN